MSTTPIADYALLSDRQSAALVSRDGSVDWLCFPRFDSPSILGRLLGDAAGHWSIRAAGATEVTRRYLDRTMVLESTFRTPTGTVAITDALAMGEGNRGHELGQGAPHLLLRRATCLEGEVELSLEYVPRPSTGWSTHGSMSSTAGWPRSAERTCWSSLLPCPDRRAVGGLRPAPAPSRRQRRFRLASRKRAETGSAKVWSQSEIDARLDDTVSAWESWSELHQAYVGPWRDLVHHSGRVLQSLSFAPTGAICAAATTSLPEVVGGARNWDYRYAWVRDASFTIEALWVAACPDEANRVLRLRGLLRSRLARPGRRPADHVRHRRRTRPDRAGAAALGGLATLCTRPGRQRRLEPAPT